MIFGVAKDIISPAIPIGMAGYGSRYGKFFKDIHDDLFVRCLYTETKGHRLLMVTYDLAYHYYTFNQKVLEYANDNYGLSKEHLAVSDVVC